MPGHEVAAIHAYPELTPGAKKVPIRTTCGVSNELLNPASEFTYQFLFDVFDELAEVFPAPYVHLGGDEAGMPPLDCWTNDSSCNALKARLGITSRDRSENWRLQKYLFDRVIAHLRDKLGKTPMFWYETDFKEIQPGCVTFAWRNGLTAKALEAAERNNVKVMLCPGEHCYLDYPMAPGDLPEVNWGMPSLRSSKPTRSIPLGDAARSLKTNTCSVSPAPCGASACRVPNASSIWLSPVLGHWPKPVGRRNRVATTPTSCAACAR